MDTEQLYSIFRECTGVCTDTRNIKPGSLFVALKGPNFNGNRYCSEALAKGAKYALTDDPNIETDQIFLVPDGLTALQLLAAFRRRQLDIPVLAVCGSNGKTTTKELCAAALSAKYHVYSTPGNLNNHIGVPLCLLGIPDTCQLAVIEMGANAEGETALLCEIAAPTHGIITNIGRDHLEGFGTIEGTARANGELFRYLQEHNGTAFVNTEEAFLADLAKGVPNIVTFPGEGDTYALLRGKPGFMLNLQTTEGTEYTTCMIGNYNFANAAAALCVAQAFGIPAEKALERVCAYTPSNNRSQLLETGKNTLILDAYNANPSSMQAALNSFSAAGQGRAKMVILGDMLELGSQSAIEHHNLGQYLASAGFETVILIGPEMNTAFEACKSLPSLLYFPGRQTAEEWLANARPAGKLILLKASRGIGLEKLIPLL